MTVFLWHFNSERKNMKEKNIKGQVTLKELTLGDFCSDISNYVVQSNDLIFSEQKPLSEKAFKLTRLAIMQIKPDDNEFKPFTITLQEFANMLGIDSSNLYKIADDLTTEIQEAFVKDPLTGSYIKVGWTSLCSYVAGTGIILQLNDKLKPYLLNVKEKYTKYTAMEIVRLGSSYTGRPYEFIQGKIIEDNDSSIGKKHHVVVSVSKLRELTGTTSTYQKFAHFKDRVLNTIVKDINEYTSSRISYTCIKTGRVTTHIDFVIEKTA